MNLEPLVNFAVKFIFPALIPAGTGLVTTIVDRLFGRKEPQFTEYEQYIKKYELDIRKMELFQKADEVGADVYRWVKSFRAGFRYFFGLAIFIGTVGYVYIAPKFMSQHYNFDFAKYLVDMNGSVFAFFFGDRVYIHLKKNG